MPPTYLVVGRRTNRAPGGHARIAKPLTDPGAAVAHLELLARPAGTRGVAADPGVRIVATVGGGRTAALCLAVLARRGIAHRPRRPPVQALRLDEGSRGDRLGLLDLIGLGRLGPVL